jgi:hypothetical protein
MIGVFIGSVVVVSLELPPPHQLTGTTGFGANKVNKEKLVVVNVHTQFFTVQSDIYQ